MIKSGRLRQPQILLLLMRRRQNSISELSIGPLFRYARTTRVRSSTVGQAAHASETKFLLWMGWKSRNRCPIPRLPGPSLPRSISSCLLVFYLLGLLSSSHVTTRLDPIRLTNRRLPLVCTCHLPFHSAIVASVSRWGSVAYVRPSLPTCLL